MAATTGMLIAGYMSVRIRSIVITPISTMSIASTTKVYGLRRARRTIHIGDAPGTFRTCTHEWVHPFSFTARANRDSKNQACIPLARGTGDRFPTGGLIALCTNASLAVGWYTGERGQVTAFRLSGLQDRLHFPDDYAFETASCSDCAISK